MTAQRTCDQCGQPLAAATIGSLCPDCLAQLGKAPRIEDPPASQATTAVETPPPPMASEMAGMMIGRYKLLEKLGEGGFGVVWAAEQREPIKRRVALKIIKLGMDTKQVVARFEAERQALALMDHPNIAKVLDAGATSPDPFDIRHSTFELASGRPYFVMELVHGIPITRYCDENKLGAKQRLDLFIRICHAIQHAHQKGIIHRDLKPSNILVTLHDGVPVPKVIDFGIAKATQQDLTDKTIYTKLEQFIGTPAYMSPEQAEMSGLDIDTRSDIYSLGVLLYELLTGKTPFDARELMASGLDAMRKTIRETDPPRPSTKVASLQDPDRTTTAARRGCEAPKLIHLLRGDLDWIVMKCLEKDRTRRYETANGLAMDLERHLNHAPVVARPPSAAYRLQKAFQRNRLAFVSAGAVAAALVLGSIVTAWQALRATRAERQQNNLRIAAQTERDNAQAAEKIAKDERLRAERHLYAANLNLVQQAWEQNNAQRVRQLLEETAGYPERGFEWYYWQQQLHSELKTLRGHIGEIFSVAFSPDGKRIATASADHTAKVWDTLTGKEQFTLKGHKSSVWSVAFSPNGQRIVTGSADQTATAWDAATGKELIGFHGHSGTIRAVAFSPDNQRLATACNDQTAKLWDTSTGRELLTLRGHSNLVSSVAFSPDGRRILTGSDDLTAKVWDAVTGRELLTLRSHSNYVSSVAFSPDGYRILTGSDDHTAKVWDAVTGRELLALRGHRLAIGAVAFSPVGQRIATGSSDQTAKVWDAITGKEWFTVKGHEMIVNAAVFSPDGRLILTGSEDRTAKLWEVEIERESRCFRGHTDRVWSAAFSPHGLAFVTGSGDQTAKLWDAISGKELHTFAGHIGDVRCVAFSPDGRRVVTGSWDQSAKVWDTASGRELFTLTGHSGGIRSVAFSPDGLRIATGAWDKTAKLWDSATGKELLAIRHGARIQSLAFSPDGQRVVTGGEDQTARLWDSATGRESLVLRGHKAEVRSVAFSRDGQLIATGSWDHTARVWDASTGAELLTLRGHGDRVEIATFSPDSRRIATGSWDQTVKLWDTASGKELLTLQGHTEEIRSVAFSPDSQWIGTASGDQTARLWGTASAAQVRGWIEEEQAAADRLALLERAQAAAQERQRIMDARDEGAIKEWLVLVPIAYEGQSGFAAANREQLPQEANLRPRAGERVSVSGRALIWSAARLDDYLVDFQKLAGEPIQWSMAYAVSYVVSDADRTGLLLKVGSDDQAKVYLNGLEIYRRAGSRPYVADEDVVAGVTLKAGQNTLVFKVVNETASWQGSIRFTDAAGNPLKGIRITLDPDSAPSTATRNSPP